MLYHGVGGRHRTAFAKLGTNNIASAAELPLSPFRTPTPHLAKPLPKHFPDRISSTCAFPSLKLAACSRFARPGKKAGSAERARCVIIPAFRRNASRAQ